MRGYFFSQSPGCFLKTQIKRQAFPSYLVCYMTILHSQKKWIPATNLKAHSYCFLFFVRYQMIIRNPSWVSPKSNTRGMSIYPVNTHDPDLAGGRGEGEALSLGSSPHFTVGLKSSWRNKSASWKNTKEPALIPRNHEKHCVDNLLPQGIYINLVYCYRLSISTAIFVLRLFAGVAILF